MEDLAADQPKCCYCDVTLVDLSFRFDSSSPERINEIVRSYLSAQQTVKRCCFMDQFGLKGHTPEEKLSFGGDMMSGALVGYETLTGLPALARCALAITLS
jgi:hypothetical protein